MISKYTCVVDNINHFIGKGDFFISVEKSEKHNKQTEENNELYKSNL